MKDIGIFTSQCNSALYNIIGERGRREGEGERREGERREGGGREAGGRERGGRE